MRNNCQLIHEKINDEEFVRIANSSKSVAELMRQLGYKSISSFKGQVEPRCKRLGIIPNRAFHGSPRHTDEEVLKATKGAKSIAEVMRRLGLYWHGYGHGRFKKRLAGLGVVFEDASAWNRGKPGPRRLLNDYLIKDGPNISSSDLRQRLVRDGIKEAKCEKCGITEWNGEPAPLQLDHVNGDRDDNRLSNLRIYCANCHCQTKTHSKTMKARKKARVG